jgi:hypothetical protein
MAFASRKRLHRPKQKAMADAMAFLLQQPGD